MTKLKELQLARINFLGMIILIALSLAISGCKQKEVSTCCEIDGGNVPGDEYKKKCGEIGRVVFYYHYEGQSNTHEVVLEDATTDDFLNKLQELANKNAWVHQIDIWGHGGQGFVFLHDGNTIDVLNVPNQHVSLERADGTQENINDLLEKVLVGQAEVNIYSCGSGDRGSIAEQMSEIFRDRTIYGAEGDLKFIPGLWIPIGDMKGYRNGQLVDD